MKTALEMGNIVIVGDYLYTNHHVWGKKGSPRCIEFLTAKTTWEKKNNEGTPCSCHYGICTPVVRGDYIFSAYADPGGGKRDGKALVTCNAGSAASICDAASGQVLH